MRLPSFRNTSLARDLDGPSLCLMCFLDKSVRLLLRPCLDRLFVRPRVPREARARDEKQFHFPAHSTVWPFVTADLLAQISRILRPLGLDTSVRTREHIHMSYSHMSRIVSLPALQLSFF